MNVKIVQTQTISDSQSMEAGMGNQGKKQNQTKVPSKTHFIQHLTFNQNQTMGKDMNMTRHFFDFLFQLTLIIAKPNKVFKTRENP